MENKSKNYEILQIIAKIGRILSTVAFVFSIIGICGCLLGWISTSLGSDGLFKIEGITIHGLLSDLDDSNGKSVGATLAAWLIMCAGTISGIPGHFAAENAGYTVILYFAGRICRGMPVPVRRAVFEKASGLSGMQLRGMSGERRQFLHQTVGKGTTGQSYTTL